MDPEVSEAKSIPFDTVKKLMVGSVLAGLVGGVGGQYVFNTYAPGTLAPSQKQALTVEESSAVIDVVNKVGPSVVSITTSGMATDIFGFSSAVESAGTGIILTADGLIMTNKHVVEDSDSFSVFTSDGTEYKDAKVVAVDPSNDVAFLRIQASGLTPAELGDSSSAVVGQRVVAIGNALGKFQNTATEGIISGLGRPVQAQSSSVIEQLSDLIQTDAAINPGNSGGPLVNLAGQVIGMNTAVAGNAQNIGFAIPTKELEGAITSVKEKGKIIRPYLGVRYIQITRDFAARNDLEVENGAYVAGGRGELAVLPNSPAAKAGLREGDIITKINSEEVTATRSLSSIISKHKVGDKVKVTFIRDGKEQTAEATLEEAK